jgi:HK97 family phage major capsid protein
MKDLTQLNSDLDNKVQSAKDITNKADEAGLDLTDEEEAQINKILADAEALKEEIKKADAKAKAQKELRDRVDSEFNAASTRISKPQVPNAEPSEGKIDVRVKGYRWKYGSLKAFKDEKDAYRCGMWAGAVVGFPRAKAFCERNGIDIYNVMVEGTDSLGGVFVPPEWTTNLILLREKYGVLRGQCQVVPMARETYEWPRRTGGITTYWTGEGVAATASDSTYDMVNLVVKKLTALTFISEELDEDSIVSVGDRVIDEFAYGFAKEEDTAGFIGDGTSAHGGITGVVTKFNNNTSLKGAVAATTGHHVFTTFDSTDITKFMGYLPDVFHDGAKFYCSRPFYDSVFQRLAAAAGGNTVQTLSGKYAPAYLGYEIVTSQVFPLDPTADNTSKAVCLFGRLDKSTALGERRGITVKRDDSIKFIEGQIAMKANERIDIVTHDVGDNSNAGPTVALMGA